jgi:hypothetical protein
MPLHILFCDEMLLYFILRIGVVEIQIWFEFNLQIWKKKLKNFPIHYTGHGPKPQVFLQTGPVGLLLHSPLWPGLVAWPGAQWPAWAHAGLIFLVETWREGSFLPQPKIHQIPTETRFKLRLEIASELYSCCVESGSKTPINRRAFMQNFCKNRAKP